GRHAPRPGGLPVKRARPYGPAGIGNLAAGFDVLGAAVAPAGGEPWGDIVEIGESGESGESAESGERGESGEIGEIGEIGKLRPAAPGLPPDVTLICDGPFAHQLPAEDRKSVV